MSEVLERKLKLKRKITNRLFLTSNIEKQTQSACWRALMKANEQRDMGGCCRP